MTSLGFNCPPGTRLIIQRPDGYITALVEGTVRITHEIVINEPPKPDVLTGARIATDFKVTEDEDGDLWTIALGKYQEEDQ